MRSLFSVIAPLIWLMTLAGFAKRVTDVPAHPPELNYFHRAYPRLTCGGLSGGRLSRYDGISDFGRIWA